MVRYICGSHAILVPDSWVLFPDVSLKCLDLTVCCISASSASKASLLGLSAEKSRGSHSLVWVSELRVWAGAPTSIQLAMPALQSGLTPTAEHPKGSAALLWTQACFCAHAEALHAMMSFLQCSPWQCPHLGS